MSQHTLKSLTPYRATSRAKTIEKRIKKARMNIKTDDAILILIACYCDLDIQNTVDDLILKASNKEKVHFFILDQSNHEEAIRIHQGRVERIDPRLSEGVCWARDICQRYVGDFEYVLQIDAHMRVDQDWDRILKETYSTLPTGSIISGYPSVFSKKIPKSEKVLMFEPAFFKELNYSCLGVPTEPTETYETVPSPYICCCFLFTRGMIYKELVFPTEIFFIGEEVAITLGAYTKGYNIYQMTKQVIWHNYLREDRSGFVWRDRADLYADKENQYEELSVGLAENKKFHWMGNARTLADFEKEFGLSFSNYSTVADKTPSLFVFDTKGLIDNLEDYWMASFVIFDKDDVAIGKLMIKNEEEFGDSKPIGLSPRVPKYGKLLKRNCNEEVESVFLIEEIVDPKRALLSKTKVYGIKEA